MITSFITENTHWFYVRQMGAYFATHEGGLCFCPALHSGVPDTNDSGLNIGIVDHISEGDLDAVNRAISESYDYHKINE